VSALVYNFVTNNSINLFDLIGLAIIPTAISWAIFRKQKGNFGEIFGKVSVVVYIISFVGHIYSN
jgi:hypothetical protein